MFGKQMLLFAAVANFGIALLHFIIPFYGAPAYIYFGAAELALPASHGSLVPALLTWGLAIIFAGFGFYLLSGVGIVRRLPLLTLALIFIGGIYTLRGLIFFLDLIRLFRGAGYPIRQTVFSATALVIGLMVLIGISLKRKTA